MALKEFLIAGALLTAPVAAFALPITGQIDIAGTLHTATSSFNAAGHADLDTIGIVINATGDFAGLTPLSTLVTLADIEFSTPAQIWSVGGFTFTATSFDSFEDTDTKAFVAHGILEGAGFDPTEGELAFTSQLVGRATNVSFSSTTVAPVPLPAGGLLLITALGAGVVARRRKA